MAGDGVAVAVLVACAGVNGGSPIAEPSRIVALLGATSTLVLAVHSCDDKALGNTGCKCCGGGLDFVACTCLLVSLILCCDLESVVCCRLYVFLPFAFG